MYIEIKKNWIIATVYGPPFYVGFNIFQNIEYSPSDFSATIKSTLKWLPHANLFAVGLKNHFESKDFLDERYNEDDIAQNCIQTINLFKNIKKEEILIELNINDILVVQIDKNFDLNNLIDVIAKHNQNYIDLYPDAEYELLSKFLFNENSPITIHMKLNIDEYILLSSNTLYPVFIKDPAFIEDVVDNK